MKNEILNLLSTKDICDKYGIKVRNSMCSCPLHKDNRPSMKIYDKGFCCFSCNTAGDFIRLVERMFNLSFRQAMLKINADFNLNLETHKYNKDEYIRLSERLKKEKEERDKRIAQIKNKIAFECYVYNLYYRIYKIIKKDINSSNWEQREYVCSNIENQLELIDLEIEELIKKLEY